MSKAIIAIPPSSRRYWSIFLSVVGSLALILALVEVDSWLLLENKQESLTQEVDLLDEKMTTARLYEKYKQWTYSENRIAYSWQRRSTKIIFWVSILVTVSGVSLAFWQFSVASQEATKAMEEERVEIKTALISLAFRSRSIAALLLFISLAYLLIYATLIYPIREVHSSDSGSPANISEAAIVVPTGTIIPYDQ